MVNLHDDLSLMVHCAMDEDDPVPGNHTQENWERIRGGFEGLDPFTPIYFKDAEYRRRRQQLLQEIVLKDNAMMYRTKANATTPNGPIP